MRRRSREPWHPRYMDGPNGPCATAFTLVEMLITVVLSAMMVTATATVTVQAARTRREVELTVDQRWSLARVLNRFREDIGGRLRQTPEDLPSFRLLSDPEELCEVLALAGLPEPEGLFPRRLPAQITYLRKPSAANPDAYSLVRRVAPLVQGDYQISEEILADELRDLRCEEFRDGQWRSAGPKDEVSRRAGPLGVRLSFRDGSSDTTPEICTVLLSDPSELRKAVPGGKP